MTSAFRLTIAFTLFLAIAPVSAQQRQPATNENEFVLKLYPLGELATETAKFSYNPALPTTAQNGLPQTVSQSVVGVSGGGQGGGGGFFSVPTATQFGTVGGGLGDGVSHIHRMNPHVEIMSAIAAAIEPNSWAENGGSASIAVVRDVLLIRQTPEIHVQVKTLLDELSKHVSGGQPVTLDIWWLPLDRESRNDLETQLDGADALNQLHQMNEISKGHHGTIRTRNRSTSNVVSGYRMPVVTGKIPVVGNGAAGHQVIAGYVNVGLMAEASLHIDENPKGNVRLNLRTAMTGINGLEDTESTGGDIDRFRFQNQILETVTYCPIGKAIIAGSLSVANSGADEEESLEMVVVVEVNAN